jgi:hypothetical protein
MEQHVKLAAKLYECRDSCKNLWGSKWREVISDNTKFILAHMKKYGIDNELKAAHQLINQVKDMDGAEIFTMKILAAAVELIEPSED